MPGAAAACARLLQLDADDTADALGIAATQAAGLKAMFGSMCKPLHAGKASADGMMAAVDVVMAKLALDHFSVGGNSMGGWVAWRYALARPERIDALLQAKAAGYDGVEVMGSEGYFLNQFLVTHTNRRADRWGIGYYAYTLSDAFLNVLPGLGSRMHPQKGAEVFYNWAVTPWFRLQADAQCRVGGAEQVYVVGDSGSFPGPDWLPKQAHMADLQAAAAAANLLAALQGRPATATFQVELMCIIDGLSQGTLVWRTAQRNVILPPLRAFHWIKRGFEWLYLRKYR